MDEAKIDKLRAAGTPTKFIREIKLAYRLRLTRWGLKVIVLVLLVVPLFALALGSIIAIEAINLETALSLADQVNGYLVVQNVGFSALLAIFGWIFAAGSIGSLITRLLPGKHRLAGLYAMIESQHQWSIDTRALRWAVSRLRTSDTAADFAGRALARYARSMALLAAPFFVVGGAFAVYEVGKFALVAEQGVYRGSQDELYRWNDVDFVEVGCNETDDDSLLIYKVHFSDGWDVNLANGTPLKVTLIEAMERADDAIIAFGKPFQLWDWLGRNPMHPACLRHYEGAWIAEEYQRLTQVLHIDELTN